MQKAKLGFTAFLSIKAANRMTVLKGVNCRHIIKANVFSFLLIFKFVLLVFYSWLLPGDIDLLGSYTLFLGLTNSFYIFAGMRSRFFVLQAISSKNELLRLCVIMAGLGAMMTSFVAWLNFSDAWLSVILLVAATKFLEMFMDAFTSFIQKSQGRSEAFAIINQHAFYVVLAYLIVLPFGLGYAIVAECILLVVSILRQLTNAGLTWGDFSHPTIKAYAQTARNGVEFTLTATLNAAQFTYFMYYSRSTFEPRDFLFVAKLLAAQSILSRILTSNNFYFKDNMAVHQAKMHRIALIVSLTGVGLLFATCLYYDRGVDTLIEILGIGTIDLILIGTGFSLINVSNVFLRQHILMVDGPRRLTLLHLVELFLIFVGTYLFDMSAAQALMAFSILRFARVFALTRPLFFPRGV